MSARFPHRLLRSLLRLYPLTFRQRKGREVTDLYEQMWDDLPHRDVARRVAFGIRLAADLLWSAVVLWGRLVVGNAGRASGEGRGMPGLGSTAGAELRMALHRLHRTPGFTTVVVLILAVGIGANVAMFSVVHAVFLKPLPFQDPGRLVLGRTTFGNWLDWNVSSEDYFDFRDQVDAFASLAVLRSYPGDVTVTGGEAPERVPATRASVNLFPTLGVEPQLGRLFAVDEARPSAPNVVLISDGYWRRRYAASPDVVGRTVMIDGEPNTIVGVMPEGFHLLYDVDIWASMREAPHTGGRQFHNWTVIGRLLPGVTLAQTQNEVDVVAARLAESYPESNASKGLRLFGLHDALAASYHEMLFMLMGAIALVLLIACGNVAGLLLARGLNRSVELSVRAALGASAWRIAGQLLTESMVTALAAGLLGAALAMGLLRSTVGLLPLDRLGIEAIGISAPMLLFAVGVSLVTAVVFGALPAIAGARTHPAEHLRSGSRTTGGNRVARLRSGFVVFQAALSVVLLIGAGLLMRSFVELRRIDPGFRTERLLTARIEAPAATYPHAAEVVRFFRGLVDEIRTIPGVQAAGATSLLPIKDTYSTTRAWNPEKPPADLATLRTTEQRTVGPGYFQAMGIPILLGRGVEYTDAELVLVINQAMARDLFEGANPIGHQVAVDVGDEKPMLARVVGVVGDVHMRSLAERPYWQMYFGLHQSPVRAMSLTVRTEGDPTALTTVLRDRLRARDPDIPLADVRTMDAVIAGSITGARVVTMVLVVFAGVAVMLAVVGLYGALAYFVTRRAHEIGIRLALGAAPSNVLRLVLYQGLVMVAIGLVVGMVCAVGLTRLIRQQLYAVQPTDPLTFVAAGLLFCAAGAVACLIPGWRATGVDPLRALQAE